MGRRDLPFCLHGHCTKPRDRRSSSYCTEHYEMREAVKKATEEKFKPASPTPTTEEEK